MGKRVLEQQSERSENVLEKAVTLRKMEARALEEQAGGRRRR